MNPINRIHVTTQQAAALAEFKRTPIDEIHTLEIPEHMESLGLRKIVQILLGAEYYVLPAQQPDGEPITPDQLSAISHYLSTSSSDKVVFLNDHAQKQKQHGWSHYAEVALNSLSVDQLGKVLFYGYQLVQDAGDDLNATNDPLAAIATQNDETEEY